MLPIYSIKAYITFREPWKDVWTIWVTYFNTAIDKFYTYSCCNQNFDSYDYRNDMILTIYFKALKAVLLNTVYVCFLYRSRLNWCLTTQQLAQWKYRELKNWIFHRFQVATDSMCYILSRQTSVETVSMQKTISKRANSKTASKHV